MGSGSSEKGNVRVYLELSEGGFKEEGASEPHCR